MAERALATAFVNIVPGTKDVEDYLKKGLGSDAEKAGTDAGGKLGTGLASGIKTAIAAAGALVALNGIKDFVGGLVSSAEEGQKVDSVLTNITNQMDLFGSKSGSVVKRLQDVATKQMKLTGIDDDAIKTAQSKLMTFSEVGKSADQMGGAFDRATQLTMDLSAAGFGSLDSASVMLGKALQDPIAGVTALSRVGVTLTEDQKAQIQGFMDVGDAASAQNVILQAVETQVGGTAAASATASEKLKAGWDDAMQGLGTSVLPLFNQFVDFLNKNVLPAVEAFADWAQKNPDMMTAISIVLGIVTAAIVLAAAAVWAFNIALYANPIGLIVAAIIIGIALVIAGIYLLVSNWDAVVASISKAWDWVTWQLGKLWTGFVNMFIDGINGLIGGFNDFLDILNAVTGQSWQIDLIGKMADPTQPMSTRDGKGTGGFSPDGNRVKLAAGGFVNRPTNALIGEAGPEVVTPLKDFERMMGLSSKRSAGAGKSGATFNIYEAVSAQATAMQVNRIQSFLAV